MEDPTPQPPIKTKIKQRFRSFLPDDYNSKTDGTSWLKNSEARSESWQRARAKISQFIQDSVAQFGSADKNKLTDAEYSKLTVAELEQRYKHSDQNPALTNRSGSQQSSTLAVPEPQFGQISGERRISFPPPPESETDSDSYDEPDFNQLPQTVEPRKTAARSAAAQSIGQILKNRHRASVVPIQTEAAAPSAYSQQPAETTAKKSTATSGYERWGLLLLIVVNLLLIGILLTELVL